MKKLVFIIAMTIMSVASAGPAQSEICDANAINILKGVVSFENRAMGDLVRSEIAPNMVSCKVNRPRYNHPAVCGTMLIRIDTYAVKTKSASYTLLVDSSYRSCYRIRTFAKLKKLTFEATR